MSKKILPKLSDRQVRALLNDTIDFARTVTTETIPDYYSGDVTVNQIVIDGYLTAHFLGGGPPLTVAELATKSGKPRSTVQRWVDHRLEEGFLRYAPTDDDARERRFTLTNKGKDHEMATVYSFAETRLAAAEKMRRIFERENITQLDTLPMHDQLRRFIEEVGPVVMEALERIGNIDVADLARKED